MRISKKKHSFVLHFIYLFEIIGITHFVYAFITAARDRPGYGHCQWRVWGIYEKIAYYYSSRAVPSGENGWKRRRLMLSIESLLKVHFTGTEIKVFRIKLLTKFHPYSIRIENLFSMNLIWMIRFKHYSAEKRLINELLRYWCKGLHDPLIRLFLC